MMRINVFKNKSIQQMYAKIQLKDNCILCLKFFHTFCNISYNFIQTFNFFVENVILVEIRILKAIRKTIFYVMNCHIHMVRLFLEKSMFNGEYIYQ